MRVCYFVVQSVGPLLCKSVGVSIYQKCIFYSAKTLVSPLYLRATMTIKVFLVSHFPTPHLWLSLQVSVYLFRCVQASLYEGLSVRPSVRPSVRRSVGPSVRPSETHSSNSRKFDILRISNVRKWTKLNINVLLHPNNRHNDRHDNQNYFYDHNKTTKQRRRIFVRQNLLICCQHVLVWVD